MNAVDGESSEIRRVEYEKTFIVVDPFDKIQTSECKKGHTELSGCETLTVCELNETGWMERRKKRRDRLWESGGDKRRRRGRRRRR